MPGSSARVRSSAVLRSTVCEASPAGASVRAVLRRGLRRVRRLAGDAIEIRDIGLAMDGRFRTYTINVRELRAFPGTAIPRTIEELSRQPGVASLKWRYFD